MSWDYSDFSSNSVNIFGDSILYVSDFDFVWFEYPGLNYLRCSVLLFCCCCCWLLMFFFVCCCIVYSSTYIAHKIVQNWQITKIITCTPNCINHSKWADQEWVSSTEIIQLWMKRKLLFIQSNLIGNGWIFQPNLVERFLPDLDLVPAYTKFGSCAYQVW